MKCVVVFACALLALGSCKLPADIANLSIVTPDLSRVSDGTWTGACKTSLVKAIVSVTVQGSRIISITINQHENGRGKAAESIIGRVIDRQSLDVDIVSGATGSSKVILKAIEQALAAGSRL